MSRIWFVFFFSVSLWSQESAIVRPLPDSVKAQDGKVLYHPIKPIVNFEYEKKQQQKNGIIGGRGDVMHSYPKAEPIEHNGEHHE